MEEPLLPDADKAYDITNPGNMGKAVEESKAEPGAEASSSFGGMENGTPERAGYTGRGIPDSVQMVSGREGGGRKARGSKITGAISSGGSIGFFRGK